MTRHGDDEPETQGDLPTTPPGTGRPGDDPEGVDDEGGPTDPGNPSS